jgi:hypothetical protein
LLDNPLTPFTKGEFLKLALQNQKWQTLPILFRPRGAGKLLFLFFMTFMVNQKVDERLGMPLVLSWLGFPAIGVKK